MRSTPAGSANDSPFFNHRERQMITPGYITKCCSVCNLPADTQINGKCQYCAEYENSRVPDYVKTIAWFITAVSILLLLIFVLIPS